ncbi:MAG TPA: riboflavin synthase [Woeseiaceae bacterium]|nr:riboflavin synthase [Woeseiaceae bacterium]
MFTGIIRAVGTVERIAPRGGDLSFSIRAPEFPWSEQRRGDSIAVNGVCLTIVELRPDGFVTDVSAETRDVTALCNLAPGDGVNLEPALAMGDRLGGHLVSGHVDCVGTVSDTRRDARSTRLRIGLPAGYRRYLAKKGSVCVDGVSLTVNEVTADAFEVNIIPHTLDATIAGSYATGTRVNIEVDLVARYLESLLGGRDQSEISRDFLRANGYA